MALVLLLVPAAAAGAATGSSTAPTTAATVPTTTATTSPPTTATTVPPTTATTTAPTTAPPACLLICPSPTSSSTTTPPGTAKVPPTLAAPGSIPPTPGDALPPPGARTVIPPDAQRQIDSVRRSGPNNTAAWLAAIQPLVTEFGMTPVDAAILGGGRFPVAGPTTWSDDWLNPRFVPTFHLHKGVDLFAPSGTPLRAPFDGVLKFTDGAVGGLAAYVTQSDGTFVYMAHMAAFGAGKVTGQSVRQGEVVGYVGDSGDAQGGSPHCHLEVHPRGGEAVPPKPYVDAWLAEATAAAPQLIAATRAARNPVAGPAAGASVTAVPDGANPAVEATVTVDPAAAAWAAASNPAIGTIDLASSLVAGAADAIAWPKPPG